MTIEQTNTECERAGPTSYFWYRTTLDISEGIDSGASINWTIAISLFITWFVVWLCMVKRIKSEGKVILSFSKGPCEFVIPNGVWYTVYCNSNSNRTGSSVVVQMPKKDMAVSSSLTRSVGFPTNLVTLLKTQQA